MTKKDAFGKEKSAMRVRKLSIMIYMTIIGLLIAGCGPSYLSEDEFVENAKGTCQTLLADISALDELDFAGKAAAYRRASDELNEFEISEESAPQGVLLRKGLSELAEVQESFANALKEALVNADMDSAATLLITEDGNVFASEAGSRNIFEFLQNGTQLDIDNEIVPDMNTKLMAVKDVATVLDLNDCAPEKIENNE